MAIVMKASDGSYATPCALCGQPLTEPFFATSHFIGDGNHPLFPYSDAAMHWPCYAEWPHQEEFAALYFQNRTTRPVDAEYWPLLHKSSAVLVYHGTYVGEISIVLRKSGTDLRVPCGKWSQWLEGEWRQSCDHKLEAAAVEAVIPELRQVRTP